MPYPRCLLWDILPRNTPNSQNLLQRCPSTDSSLGGYGILPYPRHLLCDILPQNTPNSQNLLLRCPPTDFTDLHRYLWCAVLPQNSQNSQNLAAWVWQGCHTLLHLCSSVPSVGGSSLPEVSVRSVRSVGASSPLVRLVQRRQLHPWAGSVGMAGMPYPPNLCASVSSVGVLSLQEVRCIPWEFLHRLFGWCSRDSCTPWRNPRK